MKGDPQVIAALQAQLKNELTAINQYYMHYRMYKHWGFDELAKMEYKESDRRDEARRLADGPHLHAGRPAQSAGSGQAANRRRRARNPGSAT